MPTLKEIGKIALISLGTILVYNWVAPKIKGKVAPKA